MLQQDAPSLCGNPLKPKYIAVWKPNVAPARLSPNWRPIKDFNPAATFIANSSETALINAVISVTVFWGVNPESQSDRLQCRCQKSTYGFRIGGAIRDITQRPPNTLTHVVENGKGILATVGGILVFS
jgi:hypothetical protein